MNLTVRRSAQLAALMLVCAFGVTLDATAQSAAMLGIAPAPVATAFGVTQANGILTVSSGAGLICKVRQSSGDIISIRYKSGPELQASTKASHISSGIGAATAYTVANGVIKLTLTTPTIEHYLMVRQDHNTIYMATHISAEPAVGELRWITRLQGNMVGSVPMASSLIGTIGTIESGDIFGMANQQTRSKYFGNQRAIDLTMRGVAGNGVGVYMAYGNRESSSGGPFFRDIQNQTGAHTELYNYMNSGHAQTEENRLGLHGPYALMFTDGAAPASVPDMNWIGNQNLTGWVSAGQRGRVIGNGMAGRDPAMPYSVGFANDKAQYWTWLQPNGAFASYNMKAGTYKMTVYKNELEVYTENVNVYPAGATTLNTRTIWQDPASAAALWRIGQWDGTPAEFKNGQSFVLRHPSDVRNAAWGPTNFAVGSDVTAFPAAQWKNGVNNPTTITFRLTAQQIANRTVRIGITTAQGGARPAIQVNNWASPLPQASRQPASRGLTIGTYRGNNAQFSFSVPARALVVGVNTMTINVISGSAGDTFLSPAFAYDAVDML